MNGPYLRKVNVARTVHAQVGAEVDLPPDSDSQFILWTEHVGGHGWSEIERGKGGRDIAKIACAIDRQNLSGGGGHELLKFRQRLWRQSRLRAPSVGC